MQTTVTLNERSFLRRESLSQGLATVIYYCSYRVFLDALYVYLVSPIYGYRGFYLVADPAKLSLSYLITLILVLAIPKSDIKVSYKVLQFHLILMIIPVTVVYGLSDMSTKLMLMVTMCFLLQIYLIRVLPLLRLRRMPFLRRLLHACFAINTVLAFGYLLLTQDLNLSAIFLKNIYDIRAETNLNVMAAYFVTWQYRIINPILFVSSYFRRQYGKCAFVAGSQVLIYLFYPHKGILFSIGLISLVFYARQKRIRFDRLFMAVLSILGIIAMILSSIGRNVVFALFTRLLFEPARIKFQHYEFFSKNTKLYFSEGLVGRLLGIVSPYSLGSGYLVSSGVENANTGYLIYAYDNAGFIGMLCMSVLFVTLLLIIDSSMRNQDKNIIFALVVYPMFILNDGDILTLMLTGGMFWMISFLMSYREESLDRKLLNTS